MMSALAGVKDDAAVRRLVPLVEHPARSIGRTGSFTSHDRSLDTIVFHHCTACFVVRHERDLRRGVLCTRGYHVSDYALGGR